MNVIIERDDGSYQEFELGGVPVIGLRADLIGETGTLRADLFGFEMQAASAENDDRDAEPVEFEAVQTYIGSIQLVGPDELRSVRRILSCVGDVACTVVWQRSEADGDAQD